MTKGFGGQSVFSKRISFIFLIKILTVVGLLVCFCACSTSRSQKRGASVSTAGKEAAKKPEDQKVIGSNEEDRPEVSAAGRAAQKDPDDQRIVDSDDPDARRIYEEDEAGIAATGVALGVAGSEYDEYGEPIEAEEPPIAGQNSFHVGLIGGYGVLTGDEIDGYPTIGIAGGVTSKSDRFGADLRIMVGVPRFTDATGIAEGVEDEQELAIDGLIRWYTTPHHTFVGFCIIGGLRWGMLQWQYTNPILYDDGFDVYEIGSDNLQYITPFLGIGLNLVQTSHFVLGSELSGGYKFYKWNTEEGFDNDVFDDEWMVQLLVNLSFVWGR